MHLEIFNKFDGLSRIEKDWEILYEKLRHTLSPFSSYDWYRIWWKHYSAGGQLHLIASWDSDRLIGIAPFMIRKANMHGLPVRAVCFVDNNETFLNDFPVLPEYRREFLGRALDALSDGRGKEGWDLIFLNKLSVESENYRCLKSLLDERGSVWKEDQTFDFRYIEPEGDWAGFLSSRSGRTRKTLRNVQNTLHRAGQVSVRQIRTREDLQEVWEDVCRVARCSWTERFGESMASPKNVGFYTDLAKKAAENGWLSLWTLSLDGEVIAVEFHLRADRRAYALRGHYRQDHAGLSPGTYLEMQVLKSVFEEEDRLEKYDMGDFYSYKSKWSDKSEPQMALSIFGDRFYSRLVAFHEMKTVPALRRMLPQKFWESRVFKALGIKTAPFTTRQS